AVLHRERARAPHHHGRPSRHAADTPARGRRRRDVQAHQGRRGRRLARRRGRGLLRLRARSREPHVHARDPEDGREGRRGLPDRLSGLVHGPDRPHPREGARPRPRRPHGPALLPGQAHRRRVQEGAVLEPARPRRPQRDRLDLPQRRQAVDAQLAQARSRLRGHDQDGRPAVTIQRATSMTTRLGAVMRKPRKPTFRRNPRPKETTPSKSPDSFSWTRLPKRGVRVIGPVPALARSTLVCRKTTWMKALPGSRTGRPEPSWITCGTYLADHAGVPARNSNTTRSKP